MTLMNSAPIATSPPPSVVNVYCTRPRSGHDMVHLNTLPIKELLAEPVQQVCCQVCGMPLLLKNHGAVLDLLLIFLKGSRSEPFKKINNRFETLPADTLPNLWDALAVKRSLCPDPGTGGRWVWTDVSSSGSS